jgi:very-long-chain enoyl-CoA reductase
LKGEKKALSDDTTLVDAGIVNGAELTIKDLGPQISWRTVFIIEYVSYFNVRNLRES